MTAGWLLVDDAVVDRVVLVARDGTVVGAEPVERQGVAEAYPDVRRGPGQRLAGGAPARPLPEGRALGVRAARPARRRGRVQLHGGAQGARSRTRRPGSSRLTRSGTACSTSEPRAAALTSRSDEEVPPHHLRVPDERARLRAHEGHARGARLRRGGRARRRRPDPLQHLLDPRVGRQPADRQPRRGQAPEARGPVAGGRRGGLLVAVDEGPGVRAVPVRGRGVRARARSTSSASSSSPTTWRRRATSSSRASPATCR